MFSNEFYSWYVGKYVFNVFQLFVEVNFVIYFEGDIVIDVLYCYYYYFFQQMSVLGFEYCCIIVLDLKVLDKFVG